MAEKLDSILVTMIRFPNLNLPEVDMSPCTGLDSPPSISDTILVVWYPRYRPSAALLLSGERCAANA